MAGMRTEGQLLLWCGGQLDMASVLWSRCSPGGKGCPVAPLCPLPTGGYLPGPGGGQPRTHLCVAL